MRTYALLRQRWDRRRATRRAIEDALAACDQPSQLDQWDRDHANDMNPEQLDRLWADVHQTLNREA